MSQPPHENINVRNPAINTGESGDHLYDPPHSARNQESRATSDFVDGSGQIFSMYLEMATEEDKKMAENWKDNADGILIFTGLFSAAVASLISVSIQDLQENPQDTSNFYLANMYQATINPNASSSLPTSPPPFSPPNYAVWVNALWFLSLVISITCALLATLLQQWVRRYLKVTQPRYSPHKRARIRTFFTEGVDKFLLPLAVEALPTMLHLSLFLFFAGLAVFLWNVNLTIFKLVLSWVGLCTALYGCITFFPAFRHDSPYHTPLSLSAWQFVMGIRFLTFRALKSITLYFGFFSHETRDRFRRLAERYRRLLVQGMQKTAEESAYNSPPEIDTRAFMWTFDCLDEDHELERFFSGLPGFRSSKVVKDPLPDLTLDQQEKLLNALIGLSDRTLSSDLLPEQVKVRRTVICGKAIGPADIPRASQRVLNRFLSEDQYGPVQSAEIIRLVKGWDNDEDEETTTIIKAIVSSVVARSRRDDYWFALTSDELGVSEFVLRNHATHGNDLSLAILIHVVRQQFSHYSKQYWPRGDFSKVLLAASRFDVLDTSRELRQEFCVLWNELVGTADVTVATHILRTIRDIYLTLHLYTDSAPKAFSASTGDFDDILDLRSSYPVCKDHDPAHIHNVNVHPRPRPRFRPPPAPQPFRSPEPLPAPPVVIPLSALHDDVAPVPTFPPDVPSPSVTTPVHDDENPMDVLLLDNMSSPAFLYRTRRTATETVRDSATSLDPAASSAARNNPSARTTPSPACEMSTSTPSVFPPVAVSLQDNTDLVNSGAPEIPSSASPEPVLDDITGPSLLTTRLLLSQSLIARY
ncbi:hypothetical protein V8E53_014185 [Lactarius tabidus]